MAAKKISGLVVVAQQVPIFVLDHGRQLVEVADHQQLDAAKRFKAVAVSAQHLVNGVEGIGAHHTDFVNHQEVNALDQPDFFAGKMPLSGWVLDATRHIRAKGQLKKRVDGHTARIDGGDARRGYDRHAFGLVCFELAQESSFAGARFSGQEDVFVRVAHIF